MIKLILGIIAFVVLHLMLFFFGVKELNPLEAKLLSGWIAHVAAFFFIALVLVFILKHKIVNLKHPYIVALIYIVLLAVVVELMQFLIPHKGFASSDYIDMIWNLLGGAIVVVSGIVIERLKILRK